jgi:hypothetical protein
MTIGIRTVRGLVAACLVGAAPAALSAQTIPSPYRHIEPVQSVSLFAGYLSTSRGDLGLGMKSGPSFGVRYAGRFAAPVAGVVRLAMTPSERTVYRRPDPNDLEAPLEALGDASALILSAEVGGRLLLTGPRTWHSLAPYLEVTGGLISVSGSRIEAESELATNQVVDFGPAFAGGVGLGTDWFLTDRISTGISVQGLLWRLSVPEGLSDTGSKEAEWTRNFSLSIGGAFHF